MRKKNFTKLTIGLMLISLVSCTGLMRTTSESKFAVGDIVPLAEAVEDEVVYFVVDSYEYNSSLSIYSIPAYRQETMSLSTFLSQDGKKQYSGYFWFKFKEDVTLTSYSVEINSSINSSIGYFDYFSFSKRDPNNVLGSVKGKTQWRDDGQGTICKDVHKHEVDSFNHLSASCELRESLDITKGSYYGFHVRPTIINTAVYELDRCLPNSHYTKEFQEKYLPYEIFNVNFTFIKR